MRYVNGVVMVGDRQATGGYIASRDVRKIEAADHFTAIAISGTAARGMEFIKLAQLSFEHYEKMTDTALSLEGKANYLSPIIQRNNLGSPLIVLPLLAGWDVSHQVGRIFEYDGAGGCYERNDFVTIGSGSPFAENTLRLGFRSDLDLEAALDLAALALYEAGDNDPSTGGPDFVRGMYPMMVTGRRRGLPRTRRRRRRAAVPLDQRPAHRDRWPRRGDAAVSNFFYVSPEQLIKDRAEFAQKGIARGRSIVAAIYDVGVVMVAENPSASLYKISEVYDRIAFAGVGKYNEFDRLREAGIRWADGTGYTYSREDVDARALANYYAQHVGDMFTEGPKPLEVEILVAQLGNQFRSTKLYRIAYEGTISDEPRFAVLGGDAETIRSRFADGDGVVSPLAETLRNTVAALAGPDRELPVEDLEVGVLEDRGDAPHLRAPVGRRRSRAARLRRPGPCCAASSASRPSTASPSRCAASAASAPTR